MEKESEDILSRGENFKKFLKRRVGVKESVRFKVILGMRFIGEYAKECGFDQMRKHFQSWPHFES
jgi:hypothetical protein